MASTCVVFAGNPDQVIDMVVIACNPDRRAGKRLQALAKHAVSFYRAVLGKITGCQDKVGLAVDFQHFGNNRLQTLPGFDAQQVPVGTRHQVRISQLQYPQWPGLFLRGHGFQDLLAGNTWSEIKCTTLVRGFITFESNRSHILARLWRNIAIFDNYGTPVSHSHTTLVRDEPLAGRASVDAFTGGPGGVFHR